VLGAAHGIGWRRVLLREEGGWWWELRRGEGVGVQLMDGEGGGGCCSRSSCCEDEMAVVVPVKLFLHRVKRLLNRT
jgi:hypothetical protein